MPSVKNLIVSKDRDSNSKKKRAKKRKATLPVGVAMKKVIELKTNLSKKSVHTDEYSTSESKFDNDLYDNYIGFSYNISGGRKSVKIIFM